jgi:hypothetical protein
MAILRDRFSGTGLTTHAIDRIALFRQDDASSRFRSVRHFILEQMQDQAVNSIDLPAGLSAGLTRSDHSQQVCLLRYLARLRYPN